MKTDGPIDIENKSMVAKGEGMGDGNKNYFKIKGKKSAYN